LKHGVADTRDPLVSGTKTDDGGGSRDDDGGYGGAAGLDYGGTPVKATVAQTNATPSIYGLQGS